MELARNLKQDPVSRLRPTPAVVVAPDCAIADAVAQMRRQRVGCLVVSENRLLVGVFTERDLLTRVLVPGRPMSDPIREVMTPNPVTVRLRDPIRQAVQTMQKGGYRHLPVLDDAGRPAGILSVKRIVHYLVEHFPATIYNLPPEVNGFPRHREGA